MTFFYPQLYNNEEGLSGVGVSYPVLSVAVSRANDASSFLDHLEDDATVDVAHNVGIIWRHDPAVGRRLVSMTVDLMMGLQCLLLTPGLIRFISIFQENEILIIIKGKKT